MKIKPFVERKKKSTSEVHNNPILNRVYQNRGVVSSDDIEYSISKMLSPNKMKDMDKGVDIIIGHIQKDSKILIIGDYDCDGATSTTIAVEGLKLLGAKNVEYLIPDRVIHGYGLTPSIVELASRGRPDLIITVDNGISAFDGCRAVKELPFKCELVITDHHLQSENGLPDAGAIINPNRNDCEFESKNIAGCGVIFCTIVAIRAEMRARGMFNTENFLEPKLHSLFDVLAMGTICDVVQLDMNNRLFVTAGLDLINKGYCRPGLRKILELKGKTMGKIVSSDFGFSAGPCINAAGRLDDMTIGIKCLMERNPHQAEILAQSLVDLNEARKEIEANMLADALKIVDGLDTNSEGIVLYHGSWHEGVVGIVASRIKDRLDKPTICFTNTHGLTEAIDKMREAKRLGASQAEIDILNETIRNCDIKGSARSITGIHMKHILDEIFKKHPDILSKFGGHAMAAGLSIKAGNLKVFKEIFNNIIVREMNDEMRTGAVYVDIANINCDDLTMENAELIQNQPVWGAGFESPVFSQKFHVIEKRIVGEKHLKLKLKDYDNKKEFDAIAFGCVDNGIIPVTDELEASFQLSINEYKGRRTLQLMISHLQDENFNNEVIAETKAAASRNIAGAAMTQKLLMKQK